VEGWQYVSRIVCAEGGEGLVCAVYFRNTISLFADVEPILVVTMSIVAEIFKSIIDKMKYGTGFKLVN